MDALGRWCWEKLPSLLFCPRGGFAFAAHYDNRAHRLHSFSRERPVHCTTPYPPGWSHVWVCGLKDECWQREGERSIIVNKGISRQWLKGKLQRAYSCHWEGQVVMPYWHISLEIAGSYWTGQSLQMPAALGELDVNVVIDIRMEAAPLQSDISDIVRMDDVNHPQWDLFPSTLLTPVRGACSSFSLGRWFLQIELALKYKVLLNSLYAFWLQSFALSSLVLNSVARLLSGLLHLRRVLQ